MAREVFWFQRGARWVVRPGTTEVAGEKFWSGFNLHLLSGGLVFKLCLKLFLFVAVTTLRLVFICRENPRRSAISLFPDRLRLYRLMKIRNRRQPRSSGMVGGWIRKTGNISISSSEDRNPPITADLRGKNAEAWSVGFIAWWRLAVSRGLQLHRETYDYFIY